MGRSTWDASTYATYSGVTRSAGMASTFTAKTADPAFTAANIGVRESRDSAAHPMATPIIIACDNTGSMGDLAFQIISGQLGTIMNEVIKRKPVTDPQVLLASVGDSECDKFPLQITQFESDIAVAEQTEKLYIESGGGGNGGESYPLVWYFAKYKTSCDAIEKRNQKGIIFTIGDENFLPEISKEEIKRVFNDDVESNIQVYDLLSKAQEDWDVFHIVIKPVAHQPVIRSWKEILGDNCIVVQDKSCLAEVIVSTMEILSGKDKDDVIKSWSGSKSLVVKDAISHLPSKTGGSNTGVVAL